MQQVLGGEVQPALIDTDILSMFMRGHQQVARNFSDYMVEYGKLNICIITEYEIISGLMHRDAKKQLNSFLILAKNSNVLPLTSQSVAISAEKYASLRKQGRTVDDMDLLIAGVAIANNLVLVTNNQSHFNRIEGLRLDNWAS
jgi:tRNA(fMet)-specific endonuclease VapC